MTTESKPVKAASRPQSEPFIPPGTTMEDGLSAGTGAEPPGICKNGINSPHQLHIPKNRYIILPVKHRTKAVATFRRSSHPTRRRSPAPRAGLPELS